jgi:hypothetical protein
MLRSTFIDRGNLAPWNVKTNFGNSFNGQSGNFTCIVAGVYFFAANAGTLSSESYVHLLLYKDGPGGSEWLSFAFAKQYSSYYTMGGVQAVMHLSAGEMVRLYSANSNAYYYWVSTSFSGFLLYADH